MSKVETSNAQDPLRTDVFRYDWIHMLTFSSQALKFYLAFLCLGIFSAIGTEFDTWANWIFVAISATLYIPAEINIRRAKADLAFLSVGPEGVSIRANGVTTIDWKNVKHVHFVAKRLGHYRSEGIEFTFHSGNLQFRKFGVLRRDRWTIPLFFANQVGASLLVEGDIDPIIASIERFHPVERK